MKNKSPYRFQSFNVLLVFIFIVFISNAYSQGTTSSIGDRENIGIFGGPSSDLTYSGIDKRVFAAVSTPATLFYSDDTCKTWLPAFPFDSLEYYPFDRGWGGGSHRVLTNQKGWVAVMTGDNTPQLSASVISYDNGNTFQTAIDPFLSGTLNQPPNRISAIGLSDHYLYTALGNILVRQNDTTTFGPDMILVNADTLPGVSPGSVIGWIAVSNDISGYPVYFVVNEPSGENKLFKYWGGVIFELTGFPPDIYPDNVFTHPDKITGDTVFVSAHNNLNQEKFIYRSLFGGFGWDDITPTGYSFPIADADFSPDWIPNMPVSDGLRISLPGGYITDDFGNTWQGPGMNLLSFPIATHPTDTYLILGSNNLGVAKSISGIGGLFENTTNIGFTSIYVNDFSTDGINVYYVATEAGLAYTGEYFNPSVIGYDQWISPNGIFPVPLAGDENGITAVAIDPSNSDHVICGNSNGFFRTFNGPNQFENVTPTDWNMNPHFDGFVTDIKFITSSIVIACTGYKFKKNPLQPSQPVGNIWKSTDGGSTWFIVTPMNPDEFFMGNSLAVDDNAGQPIIYCGSGYNDGFNSPVSGALWESLDMGDTWIKLTDAPVFGGQPSPLPIYDIDINPVNPAQLYLSARNIFARYDMGNSTFFFTDIPYNTGLFTSALIDPLYPDSITVTAGRNIYKYNSFIDDADLKFKGYPAEFFTSSSFGSILGGSNTGAGKITEATTYLLDIKAFMEGPFNGTDMDTTLNNNGYLPLSQPFNQPPWNYTGTESVSSIPASDIVDWVLIELRKTTGVPSTATEKTMFDRKAAFLLKDGTIVDDDGTTGPRFSIILNTTKGSDKIHAVVYSPGHVEERTATEMTTSKSNTYAYDFTTGGSQAYGGSDAHKELATGVWGMISGDGDGDGQVDNDDKNNVWLPQNGSTGYYFGDFNRDGTVDSTDLDDYWKPNAGKGKGTD